LLKRIYTVVAILAIVNLLVMVVLIGVAWASGRLSAERVEQFAMVLRGELDEEQAPATQPAATQPAPQAASEKIRHDEELEEILARRFDWHRRELENLVSLMDAARLEQLQQREALQQEMAQYEQARQAWLEQEQRDGFKRSLEYLETVDPKIAKSLLQQKKDADAAQFLSAMNSRKGRDIIEECTTPEDREWIGRVLNTIEQGAASQAEDTTTPTGSTG